jgi:outer membrane protein TolC
VTTDLLLEEGNYLTDSVNFINQQLAFRSAVRTLNQLLAVSDLDRNYNLTDTIGEMLETYDLGDLEKKMLENNNDLKTKYLSQSIIKYDLKLARSEMYPKVSLNATASNNWSQIDQSKAEFYNFSTQTFTPGPTEVLPSENRSYAINFSLTYNLFNGRKINTAIKNAAIREDIGQIEIEKMTISLRKDLYSDLDNYQIRKQIYDINKRKLKAAELNVDISKDKFKMGSINSFDYRTVQINYLSAALQELNSRYGLLESKIALMRLTGTILEVYQ